MTMNPRVRIMADTLKVCPDSEDVYTDGFWRDQTALINALDNVEVPCSILLLFRVWRTKVVNFGFVLGVPTVGVLCDW